MSFLYGLYASDLPVKSFCKQAKQAEDRRGHFDNVMTQFIINKWTDPEDRRIKKLTGRQVVTLTQHYFYGTNANAYGYN